MMKKLSLLTLCLLIISGGTTLNADSGRPEVTVYVNNVIQKQPGIGSEGEAYLPAQQLSDPLQVFLSQDESGKTVRIYKPNVNVVLIDDQGIIFGKVKSAASNTFTALVQVDNLKTEISDLKITITNPADTTETMDNQQIKDKKENFWFRSGEFTYTFTEKGTYAIRVYLKDTNSKKWVPVSEIQIFAI